MIVLAFTFDAERSTRMRPRPRSMSRTRNAAISPHRSPVVASSKNDVGVLGLVGQCGHLSGGQVVAGPVSLAGQLDTSGGIGGKTAVAHGIVQDARQHGMRVSH